MGSVFLAKVLRVLSRKADAVIGGAFHDLETTLEAMALRPFELHLELTNICNAKCIFCPYQFQQRPQVTMPDEVFYKAVSDYLALRGGSVGLTPIVGDPLIDPKFLGRVRYLRSQPEIDRIFLTTNAILFDKVGIDDVLAAGIDSINISTSGFERASYERIFQSSAYERMRGNVLALVERNAALGRPVNLSIGLRSDRPLSTVMKDPDFQPILEADPDLTVDFTWSYTSAGGRITREALPNAMKLRSGPAKSEPCVSLYNGPIVLPEGEVLACACVAAMDSVPFLGIGHVMKQDLNAIWTGPAMEALRQQFRDGGVLNETCAECGMYRDLELYRTREGRDRAACNRARHRGEIVRRKDPASGIFGGG